MNLESRFHHLIQKLYSGGVIAIPTDTVYGLACDMTSEAAIQKVYELKGRPPHKALPIFIPDADQIERYGRDVSSAALALAQKYWPGALTLVVSKSSSVPDFVTAGEGPVAVRIPNHPDVLELLKNYGVPLAVTSANRSGEKELMTADEIRTAFGDDVTVMEGKCGHSRGLSTIVDTIQTPMKIIRQGVLELPELGIISG